MTPPDDQHTPPPPRVTRPEPERRGPVRNWDSLFGPPPATPPPAGEETRSAAAAPPASLGDVVSRSVELGYRVVDDYMKQGERAAQQLGAGRLGPGALASEAQDFAGRMTRYASDFLGLWFEFLELAASGRGPNGGGTTAPAAAPAVPTAAPEHARVRVEVIATRPVEVAVDLRPEAIGRPLVAHALRAVDPDTPRIDDVTLAGGGPDAPLTLRIRVPADHPAGTYNGLLIEEATSRPAGTVSVRLTPPA